MAASGLPLVTLEEHFLSPSFEAVSEIGALYAPFPETTRTALRDLGTGRLANMDAGGVDVQVISHGPGAGNTAQCREANDHLAAAIKQNPTRFRGFATLSMSDAPNAAVELQRCVKELGFVGTLIENNTHGQHYDDESFWPVFAKAEELDVPVYIHPAFPEGDLANHYKGNYGPKETFALGAFAWGWHADTGLHFLKLYAAGLFDRFPRLQLIVGHMGEMLPFQLARLLRQDARGLLGEHTRRLQQVWDENLWITTSGMFDLASISCLLRAAKIERILFSVDFPFSSNTDGAAFVKTLEESGLVTREQLELIGHRNARALLRI